MKKVYNLFTYGENNVGDESSGPSLYFDIPNCEPHNVRNFRELDLINSFVILGGGGHIHLPSPNYNDGRIDWIDEMSKCSYKIMTWGIGHNIYELKKDIVFPESLNDKKFVLHGFRDQDQKYNWVPCASCMSNLFDRKYKITNDFVVYENIASRLPDLSYPRLDNDNRKMSDVVKFLGSAKCILTNSYHGAYWGLLLGRSVVIIDPFSSKFYNLHPSVVISNLNDFKKDSFSAKTDTKFLDICRNKNKEHYKKVMEIINNG